MSQQCSLYADFSDSGEKDERETSEGTDTINATMVSLGVISSLLCLGIGIFLVCRKRRITGMFSKREVRSSSDLGVGFSTFKSVV